MSESLGDNLENVQFMALQLRGELDSYTHQQELIEIWFANDDEKANSFISAVRKGWDTSGISCPPSYIPPSEIPSCDEIAALETAEELDNCIDVLLNALRFLRLISSAKYELAKSSDPRMNLLLIGNDVGIGEEISETVRSAVKKILPFPTSSSFSFPEGTKGSFSENIEFSYLDGYDKDLQEAVVRTRIAVLAQNIGFDFDEENMTIKFD